MKLKSYISRHKFIAPILFFLILIVGVSTWLYSPILQNAGSSNGYDCSRMHIYIPRRLDFRGCRTVTGTIKQIKVEPDGDSHALLMLDDQFKSILTQQNYLKQQGYLVIEDTCHDKPNDLLIYLTCFNYVSKLPSPILNKRYEITGNYVIDDWHGSWAEIHGVAELKRLN
jgi:hypothetical protein